MAQALEPRSGASGTVSFELERLEQTAAGRLELTGRWFGVRGLRFVRPTLTFESDGHPYRLLADLEHKPWFAEDGSPWTAAFHWDADRGPLDELVLTVATDIAIPLPRFDGGDSRPRRQRRAQADAYAASLRRELQAIRQELADERRTSERLRSELEPLREEVESLRAELERARDEKVENDAALARRDAALAKLTEVEAERDEARRALEEAAAESAELSRAQRQAQVERDRALSAPRRPRAERTVDSRLPATGDGRPRNRAARPRSGADRTRPCAGLARSARARRRQPRGPARGGARARVAHEPQLARISVAHAELDASARWPSRCWSQSWSCSSWSYTSASDLRRRSAGSSAARPCPRSRHRAPPPREASSRSAISSSARRSLSAPPRRASAIRPSAALDGIRSLRLICAGGLAGVERAGDLVPAADALRHPVQQTGHALALGAQRQVDACGRRRLARDERVRQRPRLALGRRRRQLLDLGRIEPRVRRHHQRQLLELAEQTLLAIADVAYECPCRVRLERQAELARLRDHPLRQLPRLDAPLRADISARLANHIVEAARSLRPAVLPGEEGDGGLGRASPPSTPRSRRAPCPSSAPRRRR